MLVNACERLQKRALTLVVFVSSHRSAGVPYPQPLLSIMDEVFQAVTCVAVGSALRGPTSTASTSSAWRADAGDAPAALAAQLFASVRKAQQVCRRESLSSALWGALVLDPLKILCFL